MYEDLFRVGHARRTRGGSVEKLKSSFELHAIELLRIFRKFIASAYY